MGTLPSQTSCPFRRAGRPGLGALPPPTSRPFGRTAGARFALAMGAVCGRGGPAVLGTFSHAAVRRVLYALPGFTASGGPCGLAPVLVPWLWPEACLSGVPRGPALVRRASSGLVALGAPVGFSCRRGAFTHPGGCRPRLYWLAARGTWRPAENRALCACRWPLPRQGRWARSASYLHRPSGFGLGLRALRWFGVCGPGDASGFPHCPSFNGGLRRCTGAVSCGR